MSTNSARTCMKMIQVPPPPGGPASETHRRKDIGSGYVTLAENLQAFSELGIDTPVIKSFKNLETLPACLLENQGKWRKSCHLRFNSTKRQRLRKRSLETPEDDKNNKRKSIRGTNVQSRTEKFPEKCFLIVMMNLINRLYT